MVVAATRAMPLLPLSPFVVLSMPVDAGSTQSVPFDDTNGGAPTGGWYGPFSP